MQECQHHHDCQESALETAAEICAERGLRLTKQRADVLRLIWESHQPAKAYDLLDRLAEELDHPVQPPTVYRALDFLLENGLIHRLDSINSFVGCSHPNHHADCYFMICRECRTAEECCTGALKSAIEQESRQRQFIPETTTLEIMGLCQHCRK